jgi:predicted nucleic acid-binding protein
MAAIVDASFLIALAHRREIAHRACLDVVSRMRQPLLIPAAVLPEVTHILNRRYGHHIMRRFVATMQQPIYDLESVLVGDLARIVELLEQYSDAEIDFADCSIVALAERTGIDTVLTLDRRDFTMIRPKHIPHFTILPE